jgi:hypothetical protein
MKVAWHEVPGKRQKSKAVPEGRLWSLDIFLCVAARFKLAGVPSALKPTPQRGDLSARVRY